MLPAMLAKDWILVKNIIKVDEIFKMSHLGKKVVLHFNKL